MSSVELLLGPNKKDLGGFGVSRLLPSSKRRHLGPFVFWDHIGPATFAPGKGIDVRPHPHIGLPQSLTCLTVKSPIATA